MSKKFVFCCQAFMLLSLFSCKSHEEFYRKNEILSFLEGQIGTTFEEEEFVVVFLTSGCNSCDEEAIDLFYELATKTCLNSVEKYIVCTDTIDISLLNKANFNIIIEDLYLLLEDGVFFDKNLFIHFSDRSKILFWDWVYMEKFYDIRKFYNLSLLSD